MNYRGRFAPSPTGALHFGSLLAATASYLDARRAGGHWLVRIEDLDPPRVVPGAADDILRTLERFGFQWDGPVLYQSARLPAYQAAVEQLLRNDAAYPCSCSRSELQAAQAQSHGSDELKYPGWCRQGPRHPSRAIAIRLRVADGITRWRDMIQNECSFDVGNEVGDFIIRRRDGLHAYQLAVVVDDAFQGITTVVRGADLLSSTPRQMILQQQLALATPAYAHLPVAIDANGIKLSKSTGAAAIDITRAPLALWQALDVLRQRPPPDLRRASLATLWDWAIHHWHMQPLNGLRQHAIAG